MRAPQQEKRRVLTTTLLENSYEEEDFKCEKIMQCELSAISFFFQCSILKRELPRVKNNGIMGLLWWSNG